MKMPVKGSAEMSSKAVRETGLKFWGEFGTGVKFRDISMGSREEPEARMTGCETGGVGNCPPCDSQGL